MITILNNVTVLYLLVLFGCTNGSAILNSSHKQPSAQEDANKTTIIQSNSGNPDPYDNSKESERPQEREISTGDKDPILDTPDVSPDTIFSDEEFIEGAGLPRGVNQLNIICQRGGTDKVRTTFCNGNQANIAALQSIGGLRDLQAALGLGIVSEENNGRGLGGQNGNSFYTVTAHSSSLVAKFTNAINPRTIMFSSTEFDSNLVAMGFVRGEPFAEIIAAGAGGELNFFLVSFLLECHKAREGCSDTQLLTEYIENGWQSVDIYEDIDLNNTIVDCKRCHEVPVNGQKQKILRMQELRNPWAHFMRNNRIGEGGDDDKGVNTNLLEIFDNSRQDCNETYHAGVPVSVFTNSSEPENLQLLVQSFGGSEDPQPNQFTTQNENALENAGYFEQIYNNYATGEAIAPPSREVDILSTTGRQQLSTIFSDYCNNGTEIPEGTKDMVQFYSDGFIADGSIYIPDEDDAPTIVMKACSSCHNQHRNLEISRANFTIDTVKGVQASLEELAQIENGVIVQKAIERIKLGLNGPGVEGRSNLLLMPPRRAHILSDVQINTLINYFKGFIPQEN